MPDVPTPDVLRARIEAGLKQMRIYVAEATRGGYTTGLHVHVARYESALRRCGRHGGSTFIGDPDIDGNICDYDCGPWPCPDYLDLASEYPGGIP